MYARVHLLVYSLSDCSDNSCSYACRFGAFRNHTIDGLWYHLNLHRQIRAGVTVNFSFNTRTLGTNRDVFALTIYNIAAEDVLFQGGHGRMLYQT